MSITKLNSIHCLFSILALIVVTTAAHAQVIVTSNSGGIGGPECTLRDAIKTADSWPASISYGGCTIPVAFGATVLLQAGETYTLSQVDNFSLDTGGNGLPVVVRDFLSIEGNGATIQRHDSADTPDFRLFEVTGGLSLSDLTLRNGRATDQIPVEIDFSDFSIGDVFTGASISPFLPFNVGASRYHIFSSASFGSFDPVSELPEIGIVSGVPFGLPKAICPRPGGGVLGCTGALNLTFQGPTTAISFDVGSDDSIFVDVLISLDAARTGLAYAHFELDGSPDTPHRIGLSALSFNESPDGTGAPVEVTASTEIYAVAIDSADDPAGLIYDNFRFRYRRSSTSCVNGYGGAVYAHVVVGDFGRTSPGYMGVENVVFDNNSSCLGGAIASVKGSIRISASEFTNNEAQSRGGAIYSLIWLDNFPIPLSDYTHRRIENSRFIANESGELGGAIFFTDARRPTDFDTEDVIEDRILTSEFRSNRADISGGAIYAEAFADDFMPLFIEASSFVDNLTATRGGAIALNYSAGSTIDYSGDTQNEYWIKDTTLVGNQASSGGGLAITGCRSLTCPATVELHSSTISGNTAIVTGGGIYNWFGALHSVFSTITDNIARAGTGAGISATEDSETVLGATIVGEQRSGTDCFVFGTWLSSGFNIDSDGTCGLGASDFPSTNPTLGILTDNGGPTDTHALLPGSPAIDVIDVPGIGDPLEGRCGGSGELSYDQRGIARPQGPRCDIGAFETIGDPNIPPVADIGGPYTGTAGAPTAFDGGDSVDPDGAVVSYDWDFGDGSTGSGPMTSHTYLSAGIFVVTLTVTDDSGDTESATTTVVISAASAPPIADPGGPYFGMVGDPLMLDGSDSVDPDGTIILYDWDFGDGSMGSGLMPGHTYLSVGTFDVTLVVTDDNGLTGSAGTTAEILETPVNNAPDCTGALPSTETIWPPNHKFVPVSVYGVSDSDGDPVSILIDSIFQDEPVNTYGDGDTARDGRGVATETAEVRAERSGTKKVPGNGRVYHIGFTASDGRGESCSGTVTVGVPHDVKDIPIDEGPLYDSTVP